MDGKKEDSAAVTPATPVDNTEASKSKGKKAKKGGKDEINKEDEISPEDLILKEGLELAIVRLEDSSDDIKGMALEHLTKEIRSATASMTSVPKPLKFLRPHFATIKRIFDSWPNEELKRKLADVLSVLSMTLSNLQQRESLRYRLQGHPTDISSWGHDYLKHLSGEIAQEYEDRLNGVQTALLKQLDDGKREAKMEVTPDSIDHSDIFSLVEEIIPFNLSHNAEAEAVDLLLEVRQLHRLFAPNLMDKNSCQRVCLYLIRCADYLGDEDDIQQVLTTAYRLYRDRLSLADALRVAFKLDKPELIREIVQQSCMSGDMAECRQLCFMLAGYGYRLSLNDLPKELAAIANNSQASSIFRKCATMLDFAKPKTIEDIYKTKLSDAGSGLLLRRRSEAKTQAIDSAKANQMSSFVNGFVNAGYHTDSLLSEGSDWIFKNKSAGKLDAVASLGLIYLWDVDEGISQVDKYLYSEEEHVKAGACLAIGIMSSNVMSDSDSALALLLESLEASPHGSVVRHTCIIGLGLAYACSNREDIVSILTGIVSDMDNTDCVEVSLAGLSLGLICAGTCNDSACGSIIQRLMESSDTEKDQTIMRFLCCGLGLLFLCKGEMSDAMIEAVKTIEHRIGKYCEVGIEACAYAGSGNVLKIQKMLQVCSEHLTENADHQSLAVIALSLISFGEDIGTAMSVRTFEHLLHYGELPIKRSVPLALGLLYVSNPDYGIVDQLSRLSHDGDATIAQGSILSLGLVSAGTNNSRVSGLLRQLSEFYNQDEKLLMAVRMAQGLNAMGKGLISLSPLHSDRFLVHRAGLASLFAVINCALDFEHLLLDKLDFMLYCLSLAMKSRIAATVEGEGLEIKRIGVRVGQAVETVGQPGRPRTITGFQTQETPVMLMQQERAEFVDDRYRCKATVLEGVLVVEDNPDAVQTEKK